MTIVEPFPQEPHRLEPAVAAEVVPLDQERVVRQLAEHALGDRFERASHIHDER